MPADGYVVRPYETGDEESILELFNTVFGEDHDSFQPRTLEQWRWLYTDNPAGHQIMVAVEPDGRVIAHYACLPARVQIEGGVHLAGQGVDSMVHPEFRRGLKREGPFLATARAYFDTWGNERVCAFGFGFPNKKAFRIGVRILRYVPVQQPIQTLYRNFFQDPDDDAVGREFQDAAEVSEITAFGAEHDALWERLAPHYPMALVRDAAYLNWRYRAPRDLGYRCFELRDGGALRAWFVTRAGWQDLPILALADLFCEPGDEVAVALALRTAVAEGRRAEQARVECWLPPTSPAFAQALRHGFRQEPSQYVLCIMLYAGRPELDWVRRHWYYTIGDSDVF